MPLPRHTPPPQPAGRGGLASLRAVGVLVGGPLLLKIGRSAKPRWAAPQLPPSLPSAKSRKTESVAGQQQTRRGRASMSERYMLSTPPGREGEVQCTQNCVGGGQKIRTGRLWCGTSTVCTRYGDAAICNRPVHGEPQLSPSPSRHVITRADWRAGFETLHDPLLVVERFSFHVPCSLYEREKERRMTL